MDLLIWGIVGILVLVGAYLVFSHTRTNGTLAKSPLAPLSAKEWDWPYPKQDQMVSPAVTDPMTAEDLQSILKSKFSFLGSPAQKPGEVLGDGTVLEHWAIPVFDVQGTTLVRRWVCYYVDGTGNAFWQDREPKPAPVTSPVPFAQKVQTYLQNAMAAGTTIKYATIDSMDETAKKALISAITATGATKKGLVSADDKDVFTVTLL